MMLPIFVGMQGSDAEESDISDTDEYCDIRQKRKEMSHILNQNDQHAAIFSPRLTAAVPSGHSPGGSSGGGGTPIQTGDVKPAISIDTHDGIRQQHHKHGESPPLPAAVFPECSKIEAEYLSRRNRTRRAAQRCTLYRIVHAYGNNDTVFSILADALNLGTEERVDVLYTVASTRRKKWMYREESEETEMEAKKQVIEQGAVTANGNVIPKNSKVMVESWCRQCYIFGCEEHARLLVLPRTPAPDKKLQSRLKMLMKSECGPLCWISMMEKGPNGWLSLAPPSRRWCEPEKCLALRAMELFREDACAIARILGSKHCYEVRNFLKVMPDHVKQKALHPAAHVIRNDHTPSRTSAGQKKGLWSMTGRAARKSNVNSTDENEETGNDFPDYEPCMCKGTCTIEGDCRCAKLDIACERGCSCNSTRWSNNERLGSRCTNANKGCQCKEGDCMTDTCPCWLESRTCDPDVCVSCGAHVIPKTPEVLGTPEEASVICKNVSFLTCERKKTFIGPSSLHGYGLYAGESFEANEFITEYTGVHVDRFSIANRMGGVDRAKKVTYLFDSTKTKTLDGMIIGNKARLLNFTHQQFENAYSKTLRDRTEVKIGLYTKRAVQVGEELRMDYKFTGGDAPDYARVTEKEQEQPPEKLSSSGSAEESPGASWELGKRIRSKIRKSSRPQRSARGAR
eukprot:Plantae.Rhodophyta-Hildenbrandia_rubra.ctg6011.p1 GENE.Plantae.Rhodophyta-Hildenbrandia_rubra.ctg6011~~Plantae.Rhodophyta-Hildenbrandia_rubra.ctg6011.p1  ORF type:complete len:683 (+),score=104.18 Plantae.Rhodophyta-Hildenbrandia_rubra.ctg6011:109-2157(+)